MSLFNTLITLGFLLSIALFNPSIAQDMRQEYLEAHNSARAQVGVGPLTWDTKLADYALSYANNRTIRTCLELVHSDGPYGENLAGSSADMFPRDAVNMWVSEKAYYDYNSNSCEKFCGNYTQVVWRNSVRVGCAKVRCYNAGTWIGCNYDPPGNYVGEKPY